MKLDVRVKLILIVLSATFASLNTDIIAESLMMTAITLLLSLCTGAVRFKPLLMYAIFVLVQYFVFPVSPRTVVFMLSILVVNVRNFLPTALCIMLLYETTTVSQLMSALTKMHLKKQLTVTLAVVMRYIPCLGEELAAIRDALAVRNITAGMTSAFRRAAARAEAFCVPLMVSSVRTANDLSAAAVTRGIDEPCIPSCRSAGKFGAADFAVLAAVIAAVGWTVYMEYFV